MGKVDFSLENIQKCICSTCPVQLDSVCVKEELMNFQEIMLKIMEGEMELKPEGVPVLYCGSGKASCSDIDFSKMCQCNRCLVWKEYDLSNGEPMGYFCKEGEAK